MNKLLALLAEAVWDSYDDSRRMGAVLSGGVDSSTVTALARTIDPNLPTFTGYYEAAGFSEIHYARLVAGPNHHEILITPEDFVENFDAMLEHTPRPVQGMGTFGQYMVAKYASDYIDVALSGEGSDELFGGYARLMIVAGEDPPVGYEKYWPPYGYPRDLKKALAYDYERLPDLLAVDDAMCAAFGIEARAPFTNPRVVKFGLGLPAEKRVGKRVLKEAVRGVVPDEILDRRDKLGFPVPLVEWAQGPLRDFIGDRIGYVPDPDRPWDRGFWHDLCSDSEPGLRVVA
jgi:asparagine synthetase B (glutamine-hydrolysing)